MDWNVSTRKLYIVQADRLHRMTDADNSGAYTVLGDPIWTDTTSMTSCEDSLYIISNSRLYKVNPNSGARTQLGGAVWAATRMTKHYTRYKNYLWVVQAGNLHMVDPVNGNWWRAGESGSWSATTLISCYHNTSGVVKLHIIDSHELFRVDGFGQFFSTGMGTVWAGWEAMPPCPPVPIVTIDPETRLFR